MPCHHNTRRHQIPTQPLWICFGPVWYYKHFQTDICKQENQRITLCFEKVDYQCEVYLNGSLLGVHSHAEEPFSFDVTDLLSESDNLLACRVYSPCTGHDGIDGITLRHIPNMGRAFQYYTFINSGGISGSIWLCRRAKISIGQIHILPNAENGNVEIRLLIDDCGTSPCKVSVSASICDKAGRILSELSDHVTSTPGQAVKNIIRLSVPDYSLWSPDNPILYRLRVTLNSIYGNDTEELCFGFREFCVKNGFFFLNGKRIFLKCAHTMSLNKRQIAEVKVMGFQAIRFLAGIPSKEILDYCDEIGMMVYEECAVSWGMSDYPEMPEHMAAYLDNMLLRDRNHVCVAIWGIFNEHSSDNPEMCSGILGNTKAVFDFAVQYLAHMRELDPTRLILLSSGRWDARLDIGSLSNPGSCQWEYEWGGEAPDKKSLSHREGGEHTSPYISDMGDNHIYPTVPMTAETKRFLREIGARTHPVFLSEYGVGYQLDVVRSYQEYKKRGLQTHPMAIYNHTQMKHLEAFFKQFDFDTVFPTIEDLLLSSVYKSALQRRYSFDIIRSNPNLCGCSMTSASVSNEGVYYADGVSVPGIFTALRNSFAPLKWSLFPKKLCFYAERPFSIEAILCNEDILLPGTYSALFSIVGKNGVVWKKQISFSYPDGNGEPPLAYSVFNEKLPGLPEGDYRFSAYLYDNPQPSDAEIAFRVIKPVLNFNGKKIGICGNLYNAESLLKSANAILTDANDSETAIIIAGELPKEQAEADKLCRLLYRRAQNGCRVLIFDSAFWDDTEACEQTFMQKISTDESCQPSTFAGKRVYYRNWLYHMDCFVKSGFVFNGLSEAGILDMEQFCDVYPQFYMVGAAKPDATYCAAFGSGLFTENSCLSGLTLGEYNLGAGSVLVNIFRILENVGNSPIADLLLGNLIQGKS